MKSTATQIERLALIASMATDAGLHDEALEIFEGIRAQRPTNVYALGGWAMAKIAVADYDEAIDVLKLHVLPADPSNEIAHCFLGKALLKNGQVFEGERILEQFLCSSNPCCKAMAEECLSVA